MATGTYATRKWPYDKITMPRAAPADTMSASESRLAPNAPCSPVRPDVRLATGPSTTSDKSAHQADGGPRVRAPHSQRDRQDAGCKPDEGEQIGSVGQMRQDGGRRRSGVFPPIGGR